MSKKADFPSFERFAHYAMATEFQLLVADAAAQDAASVSTEVFLEIDRLERELSRFREGSDVFRINHTQPEKKLRIGIETFRCLQSAQKVTEWSNGAFDITYGSDYERGLTARDVMPYSLDESDFSMTVHKAGLRVDLGGIGKGFALDCVRELLEEWEMTHCLVQGGGSSILAVDPPDGFPGWPVGLGHGEHRTVPYLHHLAVGASGTEVRGEHIISTRKREGPRQTRQAWAVTPTATLADALSTAFMLMPIDKIRALCASRRRIGGAVRILDAKTGQTREWIEFGAWPGASA